MIRRRGEIRDAVFAYLSEHPDGARQMDIRAGVEAAIGPTKSSSVQRILRDNSSHDADAEVRPIEYTGVRGFYRLRFIPQRGTPLEELIREVEWLGLGVLVESNGEGIWKLSYILPESEGGTRRELATGAHLDQTAEAALEELSRELSGELDPP